MDPEGKIFDERAGIAQSFVFLPADPRVVAALEKLGQFFLELRQAIGKEGAGKRQPDPRAKFFRRRLAFGPETHRGGDKGDDDQTRDGEEESAGDHDVPL
jgi:hypothetical protein